MQPQRRESPKLRMIVVAGAADRSRNASRSRGWRCGRTSIELYRHLAVCDLAVVQGGLTTAMELTANRRPFIYFPLRHHFEQNLHVRHRGAVRAGRCMNYEEETSATIAEAIAQGST